MIKSFSIVVRIAAIFLAITGIIAGVLMLGIPTQNAQIRSPGSRPLGRYAKFATSDAITSEIRTPGRKLLRIETPTRTDLDHAASLGTIVGDYGSFVVISTSPTKRLQRNAEMIDTKVHLAGASFDPIVQVPQATVASRGLAGAPSAGYYIVQLGTIANGEILDSLRDAGIEILQYVPNQAFFVYGDSDAIAKAAAHSRVRWVGEFLPEYKISPTLSDQLAAAKGEKTLSRNTPSLEFTDGSAAKFNVAVFKREALDSAAESVASAAGGRVVSVSDLPGNYFNVVQVEASVSTVEQVANIPGVISIEPVYQRRAEDERSSQIVAGNYTNSTTIAGPGYNPLSQFGVDGTNVTVTVGDDGVSIPGNGGLYITSANAVNGPLYGTAPGATSGHGHLNATIIAGAAPFGTLDPLGYNYGLGVAPKSNIVNSPFITSPQTDAQLANDSVTVVGPNGVKSSISNNSWGSGTNGNVYSTMEAEFDGFVRDGSSAGTIDPLLLIFSAGNSGGSGLTEPKVAKNIIAVGSCENLRPELGGTGANSMDDMAPSSSRGPAADGRIKPDIVAPGAYVTGGEAGDTSGTFGKIPAGPAPGSTPDPNHVYSSGTSHAAPQISGVAALFTQFWKNGHLGVNPSPAMVKAAVINTGQNLTGTGAANALPNGDEGWGRVNMKLMFNTGTTLSYFDQLSQLTSVGDVRNYSGSVVDNTKPIRVTLVWTDPPASSGANPALVNNLNLSVTVGGNTYKGNVFASGQSTTGGTADTVNNVENVWLPAGTTGTITASVTAAALNGDGILGNASANDQNYALVFYNANVSSATTAAAVDVSGRVTTSDGRGVTNAAVTMTDESGNVVSVTTNRRGEFVFTGVESGKTCIVSVASQRFSFEPKVLTLNDSVTGIDFVAQ